MTAIRECARDRANQMMRRVIETALAHEGLLAKVDYAMHDGRVLSAEAIYKDGRMRQYYAIRRPMGSSVAFSELPPAFESIEVAADFIVANEIFYAEAM